MGSYLAFPQDAVVGGTLTARKELTAAELWSAVTGISRQALALASRG